MWMRSSAAEDIGHFLLKIVRELIDVAATDQMKNRSDPEQKVLGAGDPAADSVTKIGKGGRCQQLQMSNDRDVPQAAGRLFDVRLELIKGVVELRVTFGDEG